MIGQEQAKKKLAVAVYNHYKRIEIEKQREQERRRAHEVEHPADRPDRHRQDAARADARAPALRPLHDRRRDDADRGRLRRRGRREHHPQAAAGGGRRHREVPARHHLHRRDRQDLPQGREPLDHPRRLGRGRPAGAAQDPRGHGRQRAAAGRAQAPAPGVLPGRHHEHPVHLRRRLRRARQGDRSAHRARRRSASGPRSKSPAQPRRRHDARADSAGRPHQVRADPRVRRPAARRRRRCTSSTAPRSSRSSRSRGTRITRQYQRLFEYENVKLRFTDDALEAIAELAIERKIGARGLRMIIEDLMLDLMYKLPPEEGPGVRRHARGGAERGKPLYAHRKGRSENLTSRELRQGTVRNPSDGADAGRRRLPAHDDPVRDRTAELDPRARARARQGQAHLPLRAARRHPDKPQPKRSTRSAPSPTSSRA